MGLNKEEEKNYVLIITYECGESGYLTNQPDLIMALKEYNDKRLEMLNEQSKNFPIPLIKSAKLYRVFK